MLLEPTEADKPSFGKSPEAFYAVDVGVLIDKFVITVLYTKMFTVSKVNKAVVSAPSVRVNNAFKLYPSSNNSLKGSLGTIRHDFRIDTTLPFEQAENNGFPLSASSPDAPDKPCSKIAFIDFNFFCYRRFHFTMMGDSLSDGGDITVYGIPVESCYFSNLQGRQIDGKNFTICLILASEILERQAYLFFIPMPGL